MKPWRVDSLYFPFTPGLKPFKVTYLLSMVSEFSQDRSQMRITNEWLPVFRIY